MLAVLMRTPAPVALEIVPPEPSLLPPPLPVTVKLPLVFVSLIPFVAPLAETLVCDIASGVVPVVRVISTAIAPLVLIEPPVEVIVLELSVARSPR